MNLRTYAGRVNALKRHRGPCDPVTRDAEREHRAAQLEQFIRDAVAAAPPFTREQRDRLSLLLTADDQAGGDDRAIA